MKHRYSHRTKSKTTSTEYQFKEAFAEELTNTTYDTHITSEGKLISYFEPLEHSPAPTALTESEKAKLARELYGRGFGVTKDSDGGRHPPHVRQYVLEAFNKGAESGRHKKAEKLAKDMKSEKAEDAISPKFTWKEYLKSSQVMSLFSSFSRKQKKAPLKMSKGKAPIKSSKGKAPIKTSKGKAHIKTSKGKAPIKISKGKAPINISKGKAPPKGKAPIKSSQRKAPIDDTDDDDEDNIYDDEDSTNDDEESTDDDEESTDDDEDTDDDEEDMEQKFAEGLAKEVEDAVLEK